MENVQKYWDLVNAVDTMDQAKRAEKELKTANISNEDWDELMMALTFKIREFHQVGRYR